MRPSPVKTSKSSLCQHCLRPIYYGHPRTYDGSPRPSYIPADCDYIPPVQWYHAETNEARCTVTWATPLEAKTL